MKKALLVIDAQVGLLESSPSIHQKDEVLSCIASLLNTARLHDHEVIYIMDDDIGRDDPSGRQREIHPSITPVDGDTVLHKTSTSAFFRTGLEEMLKSKDLHHLVIAGCKTEYCVDTTCRHALGLGFNVTLVADGHSTSANGVLSGEQIVAHHNRNLDGLDNHEFMIRVLPLAEVAL